MTRGQCAFGIDPRMRISVPWLARRRPMSRANSDALGQREMMSLGVMMRLLPYVAININPFCSNSFATNRRMKTPGERLAFSRAKAGFASAREAALALGVSVSTYNAHERAGQPGSRGFRLDSAKVYGRRFGVSASWLLTGEGRADAAAPSVEIVPLISWVSAGSLDGDAVQGEQLAEVHAADLADGDWIALRVEGDSMDRISPPESVILVNRRERRLVPNACYVIADESGAATYKRFRPSPDRFEPVSINPAHEPIFPDGKVTVIGRVRRTILEM
jgi:SOS-response transcriptional repressor LexA